MFKDALSAPFGEGDGLFGVHKRSRGHPFRLTSTIRTKLVRHNGKQIVKLQNSIRSIGCLNSAIDRFIFCQRLSKLKI